MIKRLVLSKFRNYKKAEISFNSRNIVFTGRNGQGKSNLLEAIFFLSVLRSFRSSKTRDIKKIGENSFYLAAEIEKEKWTEFLEVKYGPSNRRSLSIDNSPVTKSSEFINQIRAVIFSPEDINIVSSSSALRRRFVDMLISLIDPFYLNALRDYNLALKNRNTLLREIRSDFDIMNAYEKIMAENCFKIIKERQRYSKVLEIEISKLLCDLSNKNSFKISYKVDLKKLSIESIKIKYEQDREKDLRRGFTSFGPQVDEFEFFFGKKLMRSFASTGQCRLISLCLKMAKLNILCEHNSSDIKNVLVLVDDVTGELDKEMREMFFKVIGRAGQAFFTFTERENFDFLTDCEYYDIVDGKIEKK
jgi:DNA replication and repair protein RecF